MSMKKGHYIVDAVSGVLNVLIGFFFLSDIMFISTTSTRSTSKLVIMGDEFIEIFFWFLIVGAYVCFSCIFLHNNDRCPICL